MISIDELLGEDVRATPGGFERITVSTVPIGWAVENRRANLALFQVQDNPVRMTTFGDRPTTTLGFSLTPGTFFRVMGSKLIRSIRFLREGAADALVYVEYYEVPGLE